MEKKYNTNNLKETWKIAQKLLMENLNRNIWLLKGDLGTGKTSFVQGVLDKIGAKGPFSSPTFVIMKEYPVKNNYFDKVYHFDTYRVEAQDILDLSWNEIVSNQRNLVLIEWPERIESIVKKLPKEKVLFLEFVVIEKDKREIRLKFL